VASLSQGRTAAAQCGLFTHKSVPVIFEPPCIRPRRRWLYINYQLDALIIIVKYYSPLHVSSLTCLSSGGYSCTQAAYGTVTLYESFWWPVGTQREWVLTQAVSRQATTKSRREWRYHILHVYNCILL